MRRKIWLAVVALSVLVMAYFVRPAVDHLWVVVDRAVEAAGIKLRVSGLTQKHQQVVDRALEQGDQIDAYLQAQTAVDANAVLPSTLDFSSREAFSKSTDALRTRLRESLRFPPPGFEPRITTPPTETLLGEDDLAVYRELRIPTLPGVDSVGIYMRPKSAGKDERLPLIVSAEGRGGMPAPTKNGLLPLLRPTNRDMAWQALRRGYAVWMPIYVHYGREGDGLRDRLTVRAWEANTSLPAIEIAKTVRALDVLTQRPDIDGEHVAMMGHSYGGFYTLYTAALEPRISVAVVSAYLNDRASILDSSAPYGFLDWRFPGSLKFWRDPVVVALVAPRPLFIEAGNQDQLFPIQGARSVAPQAAQVYARQGIADRFRFEEFVSRHDFHGAEAVDFIEKYMPPRRD